MHIIIYHIPVIIYNHINIYVYVLSAERSRFGVDDTV